MVQLILGRSGTGKTARLLELACARTDRRQILLVPEQQSHEMERRLCQVGGDGVSLHAEVLTFSRLATRVLQTAGGIGRAELDEGGRLLLMYRVVQSLASRLTVYQRPSRRPAFLEGLLSTVDELTTCRVQPEDLVSAGQTVSGPTGDKLHDLGLIYAAYLGALQDIALDSRQRLDRAAEKLDRCSWVDGADFYLDGFQDLTAQEMNLVRLLLGRCRSLTAAFTCDGLDRWQAGTDIFFIARRTAADLRRLAKERGVDCAVEVLDVPAPTRSAAMTALEGQLFGPLAGGEVPCGQDVALFAAPDRRTEVEWTAAKIRDLARREGLRFRDIGVAARDWSRYDELVQSVFPRYGIPVFRAANSDILQKPVLTLVTAALDAVAGGYTYDDMFRYLKTGLTDLEQEERDELENYVLKWDLRGSRWTQEQPWAMHPRGYGMALEEEDRILLERLDHLRRKVADPLERLRTQRDHTGRGRAMALYAFLEEVGLSRRLEERTLRLEREGQLGLAQEYRQLWEILCSALEQTARLLGDTQLEQGEFAKLLKLVLSRYQVGTIPVSLDRVTAGEMTRQSGHGLKVLFLLGADDTALPSVSQDPGLLTDQDRDLLAEFQVELPGRAEHKIYREMTAIYTACTRPDRSLYVTWPARGSGGEELRPSFVVERLRRIFPDLKTETEGEGRFRLAAPAPALERAGDRTGVRRVLRAMPGWAEAVERLETASRWERGRLSRQAVDRLYGSRVPMSASRMDKYKACHFSYFMQYGLKAQRRDSALFSAPEYGTFVHYVLEHVFRRDDWRAEGGGVNGGKLKELTRAAVERYVQEELGGMEHQTARFRYLFARLLGGVDQVVDNVAQELAASRFRPMDFELGFGTNKDLPPVEVKGDGVSLSVTGFVDRVDGWVKDGTLYLRVVDYKTGRKSFDLTEVYHGMGLQMLLYLFTLAREGEKRYGMPVAPAGVLYLPAREVILPGSRNMSPEEQRKLTDQKLRRQGLVLDEETVLDAMELPGEEGVRFLPLRQRRDGTLYGDALVSAQRFGRLERHVERVLRDICREIAAGNIAADPFWRGADQNACRYCDYAAACHFEEGRGGDCRRWLPHVDAGRFWQSMEQEES